MTDDTPNILEHSPDRAVDIESARALLVMALDSGESLLITTNDPPTLFAWLNKALDEMKLGLEFKLVRDHESVSIIRVNSQLPR